MSLIQGTGGGLGGAGAPGGSLAGGAVFSHTISQSLKLDDSSGGHLTISSASPTATNRKKVTISCWVKRSTIGTEVNTVYWGSSTGLMLQFFADNTIYIYDNGVSFQAYVQPTSGVSRLFRDVGAWYHLALIIDTTQDSAYERAKFYVNGELNALNSYPGKDGLINWHTGTTMKIGNPNDTTDLAGYIAEFISIDGQDVSISDLGETVGGVWTPKDVSGLTLGNAGFYLKFDDSSDIGNDSGSNNIDFTGSNLAAADVVLDSPTNNFCTLNPLAYGTMGDLSEGNLTLTHDTNNTAIHGTMSLPSSGKWYYEVHVDSYSSGGGMQFGWGTDASLGYDETSQSKGIFFSSYNEQVTLDNSGQSGGYGSTGTNVASNGDIYSVLLDVDNGKFYYAKNGTYFNSADPANGTGGLDVSATLAAANTAVVPSFTRGGSFNETYSINFGQDSKDVASANADKNGIGTFEYAVPTGFLAICTSNLPDITIAPGQNTQADDYFETMLYTGNGGEQHIGAGGAQHPQDTTTIANSVRFNSGDSAQLTRTPSSAGNRATWTWSAWVKRSGLGTIQQLFCSTAGNYNLRFHSDDTIIFEGAFGTNTSAIEFKDVSAWYNIVAVHDTTESTSSARFRLYVNGTQQTTSGAYPSGDGIINSTVEHGIGGQGAYYFDGYMAEVNFIDGAALGPENFGQVGTNGYWIPKALSGLTYGTNGFRLTFQNSSYLGYDYQTSDRSTTNDYTISGGGSPTLVATDQVIDSPTQNFAALDANRASATSTVFSEGNLKTASGGNDYDIQIATLFPNAISGKWYAEFYVHTCDRSSTRVGVGVTDASHDPEDYLGNESPDVAYYDITDIYTGGSATATASVTYQNGDIISVALDLDAGEVTFRKNNSTITNGTQSLVANTLYTFATSNYGSGAGVVVNFGQDDSFAGNKTSGTAGASDSNSVGKFYYAPPSGHLALMDDNIPKTGIESPDWVWAKGRNVVTVHDLHDTVRGTPLLQSNAADGQQDNSNYLLGYGNQGFTVGDNNNINKINKNYVAWTWKAGGIAPTQTYKVHIDVDSGQNKYRFRNSADNATFATYEPTLSLQEGGTYVFDWSEDGTGDGTYAATGHPIRFSTTSDGTHNSGSEYTTGVVKDDSAYKTTITVAHGAPTLYYYCQNHSGMGGQVNTTLTHGSTNFDGSIQSIATANQTSGFSIVKYTGTGSAGTIGHGLSSAPEFIIVKNLEDDTKNWNVYPTILGNNYLELNGTGSTFSGVNYFNNTAPTTTVFSVKSAGSTNASGEDFIAYCFHSVEGYSKFGSYLGNNAADGTFVYTGFRPAWLMVKRSSGSGGWHMFDSKRSTFNEIDVRIEAQETEEENTSGPPHMDFLSNGFKMRTDFDNMNAASTYIYLAFAEAPYKFSNAR